MGFFFMAGLQAWLLRILKSNQTGGGHKSDDGNAILAVTRIIGSLFNLVAVRPLFLGAFLGSLFRSLFGSLFWEIFWEPYQLGGGKRQ
jgi:hypothetical protein